MADNTIQELIDTQNALLKAELRINSLEMSNTALAKMVAGICALHIAGQHAELQLMLDGMALKYQAMQQQLSQPLH